MTGLKPIYFEGGMIKLHEKKKQMTYELKVWLNSFNYVPLETGIWNNNEEELIKKVVKVRENLRQGFANSTILCKKCKKPMTEIGEQVFCFQDKIALQKSGVVTQ